jgi:tetratricopeptide (TPR) repeat protein
MRRASARVVEVALSAALTLSWAARAAASPHDPSIDRRLAAVREAARANSLSAEAIASKLTALAEELSKAGDVPEAIELLSEALGRDPGNGVALADLILAYLRNGDAEFADFYLDQAVSTTMRVNPPASAYATIGDAFAAQHLVDEALTAWEHFRRLGGSDPSVDQKIERARKEQSVRQPQRVRASDKLVVYTDASIPADVAEKIETHLLRESDRLVTLLPSAERLPLQVAIVYEGRAYFSLVSIPNWVSGVFDGKIRVSVEAPARWKPELAAVLSHELMHAYLRAVSRGRAPAWLHEGLAQWFQGERIPSAGLKEFFARRRIRSLDEMEAALARRPDRETAREAYVEALGLVEFLTDGRGAGTIACIVADLAEDVPMESALTREAGLTPAELVAGWKKSLRP